ncbi:MAG: M23 family metallopeptidase [Bacillota bacterium]
MRGRQVAGWALRKVAFKGIAWLAGFLGAPVWVVAACLVAVLILLVTLLGFSGDPAVDPARRACQEAAEVAIPPARSAYGSERAYDLPWGLVMLAYAAAGEPEDLRGWTESFARDVAPRFSYRESEVVQERDGPDGPERSVEAVLLLAEARTYRGVYEHLYRVETETLPDGTRVTREVPDRVVFRPDASLLEAALASRGLEVGPLGDFVQVAESVTWGVEPGLGAEAEDVALGGALGSSLPSRFAGDPGEKTWPLRGPVTSPFGMRVHPVYGVRRMHTGVDIAAPPGTPVVAARGGLVAHAGWAGELGLAVAVDHGGGEFTVYGHLSRVLVEAGQEVSSGQAVGLVGATGTATGPHLHFAVWRDGQPLDPMGWLPPR